MQIIGRLTADAKVNTTKSDKQVVNFTVAMNDYYRTKEGEAKSLVTYVNCAYWISTKIAEKLTKGKLVELYGRMSVNAYTNMEGQPRASLNFHVNSIKPHGGGKTNAAATEESQQQPEPETADDLPF